jgi:hypothetical protein
MGRQMTFERYSKRKTTTDPVAQVREGRKELNGERGYTRN